VCAGSDGVQPSAGEKAGGAERF